MKNIILFLSILTCSFFIQAQTTHTVINTNDTGLGSLRAAEDSCAAGDTIRFAPSLIANGSDSIVLTSGEIVFGNRGVIIKGLYNASDTLFISGNQSSRIFSFNGPGKVVLDSLVLKNGNGFGSLAAGYGGAVIIRDCSDTLYILNSNISNNTATSKGGGISSYSYSPSSSPLSVSSIRIINSTISRNKAPHGGGVYSSSYYSTVKIINSSIKGNIALNDDGGGICSNSSNTTTSTSSSTSVEVTNSIISGNTCYNQGGGISSVASSSVNALSSSNVSITNSTISGNNAPSGNGGGMYSYSYSSSSSVTINRCTVSNNTASSYGGGIYSSTSTTNSPSSVNVSNSTISGNSANFNGGAICYVGSSTASSLINGSNSTISGNNAWQGAGVYSISSGTIITLTGSIVAENGSNSSGIYTLGGVASIVSNGYNAFSDSPIGKIGTDKINVTAAQLNLQALTFNGGNTKTMSPGLGSYALNNGNPNDSSDAQNAPIVGTRNIGSTENCYALPSSISVSQCSVYTVPSGNHTYNQSGIYTDTIVTTCGADSLITIDLNILSHSNIDVRTACDSLTWIDGNTYYMSNTTASDTFMNVLGCDSVIFLDLTILSNTVIDSIIACDSLTWINGTTYYSNNNSATDTLVNTAGCDSIVTLDLTIINSTSALDIITACDSLTWINGVTYYSSIIGITDTLTNSLGCDSIVTLDLTINTIDSTVIQIMDTLKAVEIAATYQWINCTTNTIIVGENSSEYVPNSSGIYKVVISKGGCMDTSACYEVIICDNQAAYSFIDNGLGNIDFIDLSVGSYTQIHWYFGDGESSTSSNPIHTYQTNGTYVVILTTNDSISSNACTSYFMDTISVTGVSTPLSCKAGFSVYYDTLAGTVNVVNSSVGSNLSYSWSFGDGSSSTLQFPTHSYATNGPFNLCLTIDDGNGCVDTYCDSISNQGVWFRALGFDLVTEGTEPTGIVKIDLSNNINIYPNPVHDHVNIELNNWPVKRAEVIVRDLAGHSVFNTRIESISNSETVTINTSKWAKGTYFIEVSEEFITVTEKIIVQ